MSLSVFQMIDRYFIKKPLLRERVTRLLTPDREEDVTLFAHSVRIHSIKENGYRRAARKARMSSLWRDESITLQHMMLFVKPTMTFVDIGANVGVFSIMMSDVRAIYPGFRVVAFEVHPGTYARLATNAARHRFEAFNVALGSRAGRHEFVEGAVSHVTTTRQHMNSYNVPDRVFQMDVRRLDSFEFEGPLYLKIDVEGQEMAVLEGASSLFDEGRIEAVFIDGYEDGGVPAFLRERGFHLLDARTLNEADAPAALIAVRQAGYPQVCTSGAEMRETTHA